MTEFMVLRFLVLLTVFAASRVEDVHAQSATKEEYTESCIICVFHQMF